MSQLIARVTRRPRTVLAVWLVVVAAGAGFALQLDGALSGGGFTNPRAEALVTQEVVQEAFGDEPNQLVVVLDGEAVLTTAEYAEVERLLRDAGAETVTAPDVDPGLASGDGRTAVILAGFGGDGTAVQNEVPTLQAELSRAGIAQDVYVTGQPALDFQLNAHSKDDAVRAELIVFPLLLVILLVVFGSVVATMLPLLVAGSALGIASGIGFVATQFTDISNLYSNIVSMIGLAVAVDYSLFIIKRFREELARGRTVPAAVERAMRTAGRSVLYSGIAVVLALAALFIPRVMAFTSIALGGIVVTIVALAVTMLVLPAGLVLLGHRIDALPVPLPRRRESGPHQEGRTRRTRRPGLVGAVGILAMLAVTAPVLGLSLQSPVASATVLPPGDPAREGLEVIEERIGQEDLFPVDVVLTMADAPSVIGAVEQVEDATRFLADRDGVESVTAVTTIGLPQGDLEAALAGGTTPRPLAQLWARDGETITTRVLVTTSQGPDSVQAHQLVRDIRSELPGALDPSTSVAVTGATAQGLDFDDTIIESFPLVAGVVLGLTFLMLTMAFRTAVLPALALFFNVLVVGASLGLLTAVQGAVSGQPLNSVTPILLFAVMFGLSMDYMVIIISRMREAHRGGMPFDLAVADGARRTRSMVNSAALIMIAVFASFMTGQISIVREIGIGLAIAVALDAVVIRMVVMPNVLRALGPRSFGREPAAAAPAPDGAPTPRPTTVEA